MAGKHELHEKGLRLTPQRELVLSAVRALGHATPEEVAEKVRQTHPGINLSTVYRNLETLENVGLVQHTHLGHGGATYHAAEELTHLHLVFVADLYSHLVVAVDFFTEDTSIPVVAIVFFIVHIKLMEVLIFGDVPVKITGRSMRASSAGFGTERPIFSIKFKGSIGKHLLRI